MAKTAEKAPLMVCIESHFRAREGGGQPYFFEKGERRRLGSVPMAEGLWVDADADAGELAAARTAFYERVERANPRPTDTKE